MRALFSILLVFQILAGSLDYSIGLHFCGDHLVSFALFGEAEPCAHAKSEGNHPKDCPYGKKGQSKKGCCNDKEIAIEGIDILSLLDHGLEVPSFDFAAIKPSPMELEQHYPASIQAHFFTTYRPPPLIKDIPVLIQTFLI